MARRKKNGEPSIEAEVITLADGAIIAGCATITLKRAREVDPTFPRCFTLRDGPAPGATDRLFRSEFMAWLERRRDAAAAPKAAATAPFPAATEPPPPARKRRRTRFDVTEAS